MYNVFEDIIPRGTREVTDIKYALIDKGALGAVMTGSGPAVVGLFDSESKAQDAYEHMHSIYKECYLTENENRGDML